MRLYVSSLKAMSETVARSGARRMISVLGPQAPEVARPYPIGAQDHLFLRFHDIASQQEGMTLAKETHVQQMLDFVQRAQADGAFPMLIHCWMGVSRSTAAAYIAALALRPELCAHALAAQLRVASPTATPNPHLIALGDQVLGRGGTMIEAIAGIGRGVDADEAAPFMLDLANG